MNIVIRTTTVLFFVLAGFALALNTSSSPAAGSPASNYCAETTGNASSYCDGEFCPLSVTSLRCGPTNPLPCPKGSKGTPPDCRVLGRLASISVNPSRTSIPAGQSRKLKVRFWNDGITAVRISPLVSAPGDKVRVSRLGKVRLPAKSVLVRKVTVFARPSASGRAVISVKCRSRSAAVAVKIRNH